MFLEEYCHFINLLTLLMNNLCHLGLENLKYAEKYAETCCASYGLQKIPTENAFLGYLWAIGHYIL